MNAVYFGIYPGRCYDFLCHYLTPPPSFSSNLDELENWPRREMGGGDESPPVHPVAQLLTAGAGGEMTGFAQLYGVLKLYDMIIKVA